MTKDRLKDLQKTTSWPRVSYRRVSRQLRTEDLSIDPDEAATRFIAIPLNNDSNISEFLTQIDLIQLLIDKINELTKDVKRIHLDMLNPMADPKLGDELDRQTEDIKKLAYDVSTKLKRMEQIQEKQDAAQRTSTQERIKESQIFGITRRFRETMNLYNQESVAHRERCKKTIARELEISGNRRTDDELEAMLESGHPGTLSFSIMVETQNAKQSLNEIEARQRDISKLESSIRELHGMFADLALLVTNQGAMIDNIEHNVSKAVEFVDDAVVQVSKVKEYKEAAGRKKCLVVIILVIVAVVLIVVCVAYVSIQKKLLGGR